MMLDKMNDQIRQAVRVELAKHNRKQTDLAEQLGVTRQYVSSLMRGETGNVPDVWQRIFDELGLELVVQPKAAK